MDQIRTAQFISISDLFLIEDIAKNPDEVRSALLEIFSSADHDVSWGDASHTLVNQHTMLEMLDKMDPNLINDYNIQTEYDTLVEKVNNTSDQMLFDLES